MAGSRQPVVFPTKSVPANGNLLSPSGLPKPDAPLTCPLQSHRECACTAGTRERALDPVLRTQGKSITHTTGARLTRISPHRRKKGSRQALTDRLTAAGVSDPLGAFGLPNPGLTLATKEISVTRVLLHPCLSLPARRPTFCRSTTPSQLRHRNRHLLNDAGALFTAPQDRVSDSGPSAGPVPVHGWTAVFHPAYLVQLRLGSRLASANTAPAWRSLIPGPDSSPHLPDVNVICYPAAARRRSPILDRLSHSGTIPSRAAPSSGSESQTALLFCLTTHGRSALLDGSRAVGESAALTACVSRTAVVRS